MSSHNDTDNRRGTKMQPGEGKWVSQCYFCKCTIWLPQALYDAAKHSNKIGFFCAYGHEQIFAKGETELEIVRRERDRLKQDMAYKDDQLASMEKQRAALMASTKVLQKTTKRLKTRVAAGVCPCCNRTVSQMARHMHSKHPGYVMAHEVQ